MKKIEAVVKRRNFPTLRDSLSLVGTYIVDKRNLEDNKIFDHSSGSKAGSTGISATPLAKIEMVIPDKDARKVLEIISKHSGLSSNQGGRIFISEMEEVVDIATLQGQTDLEFEEEQEVELKPVTKRSRLVPLQKRTLHKLEKIYNENQEILGSDYRVRSFSDFVNYCIMKHIPTLEKQLKNPTIIYENNFNNF